MALKFFVFCLLSMSFVLCDQKETPKDKGYNAEVEIRKRTEHYKKVCEKYKDPRRPEYKSLYESLVYPNKFPTNIKKKVTFCIPVKVGLLSWTALTRKLHYFDILRDKEQKEAEKNEISDEKEENDEKESPEFWKTAKPKDYLQFFKESTRVIQVRHPLERLLSAFLFIFKDSSTHMNLSKKINANWLNNRKDKLRPQDGEDDAVDFQNQPSLTFRQFANFLTKCPAEYPGCSLYVFDGIAQHWGPFWKQCHPCMENFQYDYVLDMDHATEDKEFVFDKLGLNNTLPLFKEDAYLTDPIRSPRDKKKYFGTLTMQEVYDLYLKYKLDHEVFGYSPDDYIKLAKDYSGET